MRIKHPRDTYKHTLELKREEKSSRSYKDRFRARTMKITQKASRLIASQFLESLHRRCRSMSGWLESPDAEILGLKTSKDGSSLYLTVQPPLLRVH